MTQGISMDNTKYVTHDGITVPDDVLICDWRLQRERAHSRIALVFSVVVLIGGVAFFYYQGDRDRVLGILSFMISFGSAGYCNSRADMRMSKAGSRMAFLMGIGFCLSNVLTWYWAFPIATALFFTQNALMVFTAERDMRIANEEIKIDVQRLTARIESGNGSDADSQNLARLKALIPTPSDLPSPIESADRDLLR